MALSTLPSELLLLISEALDSERDLNAFVRTNRRLFHLLNTTLYRHNIQFSGSSALEWAARYGRIETTKKLISQQANIHITNSDGQTPVGLAAQYDHKTIVELLLQNGACPHTTNPKSCRTLLSYAAKSNHQDVVRSLLKEGVTLDQRDCFGKTALFYAVEKGHNVVVQMLLEKGADPSLEDVDINSKDKGRTPLSLAASNGLIAVVNLLLKTNQADVGSCDNDGRTPVSWAAASGQRTIIKSLLQKSDIGKNLRDKEGRTPFSWAVIRKQKDMVKFLLEIDEIDINPKNHKGQTPLLWATINEEKGMVKLLVENDKIDINSRDVDADLGYVNITSLLLGRGDVDINMKDKSGRTPLSWAVNPTESLKPVSHEMIVQRLLATGRVDVNSRDNDGWTPLSRLLNSGHRTFKKGMVPILEAVIPK
ncbi:ankyrin repeat-containing domain protein [Talaromyces proteolyticus]|uniref:Ankyrin repeat-containing domain protein n=1 Tax=Talaromyces proteolyticus TaxID=1131652 RepID=A0AAD4PW34_9EURO|nr:ankyrin repeat-containing domain protein [Talaromyces proteolyticus]KAH8697410.1 ankyrin repeat-containing domain protein [Talaromyces proteolyticus]